MPDSIPKDVASIVLGAISLVLSFVPVLVLQVAGIAVGAYGFTLARAARRADYRKDLTCTVGKICCVAGVVLCALGPVLYIVGTVILAIAG